MRVRVGICTGPLEVKTSGWRLPTVHELVNLDSSDASFLFVDSVGEPHWSSTTYFFNNDLAQYVLFGESEVTQDATKNAKLALRAVRCGPE